MGALTSRQHAGVEEVDIPSNSVYRYPPKSGERERGLRGGRDAPARGVPRGPRRPSGRRRCRAISEGGRCWTRSGRGCFRALGGGRRGGQPLRRGLGAACAPSGPVTETCARGTAAPRGGVSTAQAGPLPSRPVPGPPQELRVRWNGLASEAGTCARCWPWWPPEREAQV